MYENCRNCGYPEGLHHYETMQCPKGGEAAPGKKQEWLGSVYMPDTAEAQENRIDALEKRIALLEKRIVSLEKNFKS